MSAIFLTLFTVLIVYMLIRLLPRLLELQRCCQMAAKIPGLNFWESLNLPSMDYELGQWFTLKTQDAARRGESVIGMWFAQVYTIIPITGKAVKDILENQQELTKASDYDILKPWLGDGLLISTGDKWKHRRRLLTPTFHFAMLEGYVKTMDKHASKLSEYLKRSIGSKTTLDVFPIIKRTTLDIICETAMGIELNSLEDKKNPYALAVAEMGTVSTKYSFTPLLWFAPYRWLSGYEANYNRLIKTLTSFTEDVIKTRRATRQVNPDTQKDSKRKAFIDMLFDMEHTENFTDEDIREQVDTFMFGGHDTTSTLIGWTIWCLATHPEIQEKVAEEICGALDGLDELTINHLKGLHYFDRVIKETMRINPPIPFAGRYLENDIVMDGHLVPRGTNIYIGPLMIHRNETIYPDPMKFDPDRFLPEACKERNAYDYIPFSAGPRNCIGQKFGLYEARIILARLIKDFKFSTNIKFMDNLGCPEIILRPQHGIPVFIHRRRL